MKIPSSILTQDDLFNFFNRCSNQAGTGSTTEGSKRISREGEDRGRKEEEGVSDVERSSGSEVVHHHAYLIVNILRWKIRDSETTKTCEEAREATNEEMERIGNESIQIGGLMKSLKTI